MFARFGVFDCLVSDNGTQFTSGNFKDFCDTFLINHITVTPYHLRSNGQAEHFVATQKRAQKKARGTPTGKSLKQFLQVNRITPNDKTPSSLPPAQVMFAGKIRSAFVKLRLKQTKPERTNTVPHKILTTLGEGFFRIFHDDKFFWEMGTIEKIVGNMIYVIKGSQFAHKRHLNEPRKHQLGDADRKKS